MKQGDYGIKLKFTVTDNGEPLNLAGLTVNIVLSLNEIRLVKPCVIEDAVAGKVYYVIGRSDLTDPGTLNMEIEVIDVDTLQYTTSLVSEIIEKKL